MKRDPLVELPEALTHPRPRTDARFIMGLDGGATKTLAAVMDLRSGTLHLAHGGPSNEDAVGAESAVKALLQTADEAIARAGIGAEDLAAAVLAVAGTDTAAVAANVRAAAAALGELGAIITDIEVPGADRAARDCGVLIRAEALAEHRERLEQDPGRIGEDVRRRLELGYEVTGVEVAESQARMRRCRANLRVTFDHVDLILTPSTPGTAPLIEGADMIATSGRVTRVCYPWSLAGLPSIAAPCGLDERGLPTGLQLAAAPWRDTLALRVGTAYQRVTDFHRQRPPSL